MCRILNKRDTVTVEGADSDELLGRGERAILHPWRAAVIDVTRQVPAADLRSWIDYFWIVRWQAEEPHTQAVIPQPVVHVAAENGRLLAHGVGGSHFTRTLLGDGHVLGMALRPGAFRSFIGRPVNTVSRSVIAMGDLTGVDDRPIADALLRPGAADAELVGVAESWVRGLDLDRDPMIDTVAGLVTRAESDHTIVRAEQLAAVASMSLRSLQRLFGEYVGIGPKWVIQRFRLLDAAAVANSGTRFARDVDWAALAVDLGFSDQAHLTREFSRIVGTPPASYLRSEHDQADDRPRRG